MEKWYAGAGFGSLSSALGYATVAALLAATAGSAGAPGVSPSAPVAQAATTQALRSLGPIAPVAATQGSQLGLEAFWSLSTAPLGAGWAASVNTFTGNLVLAGSLLDVPGRGPALSESLTYNSQSSADIGFGAGWVPASGQSITQNADGTATWIDSDGSRHVFTRDAAEGFVSPLGMHMALASAGTGSFALTDGSGTISRFTAGRLASVTDDKGNVLALAYDGSGRLTAITDAGGRKLIYARDTSGRLTSIADPSTRSTVLGYDSSGRLSTITDRAGNVTTVAYDVNGRVSSYVDARGNVTRFTYDSAGRIAKIVDPRSTAIAEIATTYGYDPSTNTTTITDPAGAVTTIVHNAAGNPLTTTDPSGVKTATTWNNNEVTLVEDAAGSVAASYDAAGNVTGTTESLTSTTQAVTSASYDAQGNPISYTNPDGARVEAQYDNESNLLSEAAPARREADANTYDASGNPTSVTQVGAASTNLVRNGNFERVTAAGLPVGWTATGSSSAVTVDGAVARYGARSLKIATTTTATAGALSDLTPVSPGQLITFSATARLTSVTGTGVTAGVQFYDAAGVKLSSAYANVYTGSGQMPLRATAAAPTGAAFVAAAVELRSGTGTVNFDGVQVESPLNKDEGYLLTAFDYVDNSSFEFGSTDWYGGGAAGVPAGASSVTTGTAWGGTHSGQISLTSPSSAWLVSEAFSVTPGERLTLSGYLKTANVASGGQAQVQVQYVSGTGAVLGADSTAAVVGSTDWTRYAAGTTVPAQAVSATVFAMLQGGTGTVYADNIKLTPRVTSNYTYDATGSYRTGETDPLGNTLKYTYDAVGNVTSITNPTGAVTKVDYNANSLPVAVTDPAGGVTRYKYDPIGNGVTVQDARSLSATDNTFATQFGYDPAQKRLNVTDPLGRATGYQYDAPGRLSKVANPAGGTLTYNYTTAGRPSTQTMSNGTAFAYTYDASGNILTATRSATGETNLGYTYTYDAAHEVTSLTDPWGYKQTFTRDAAGQVVKMTDSDGKTITYNYGADGRLLNLVDTGGRTSSVRYDEAGRPFEAFGGDGSRAEIAYDDAGQPVMAGHSSGTRLYYEYDSRGNMLSVVTGSNKSTYAYDSLSRLKSWTAPGGTVTSYAYDAAGNLTKKGTQAYAYDAAGQITNTGFTYDSDGNLTSDGTRKYTYDPAGRLTGITKVSDGSLVASYRYDHRGLRIEKKTATSTVRYSWDEQGQLTREADGNGAVIARYTWSGPHQLAAIEKSGAMYYPLINAHGDIGAITNASGTPVATYNYGPWGELVSSTGTFDQPWRYAGYYYDAESSLYYLEQRYYSPTLARFLTKEPLYGDFCDDCGFKAMVSSAATVSAYAYAGDNPLIKVDPDGRKYFYILGYSVGRTARSPQTIFRIFRQHFNSYFPIPGAGRTLYYGAVYFLRAFHVLPAPVVVTALYSTGWTFTTLPGHFDGPGIVQFNLWKDRGTLKLTVNGVCLICGTGPYGWVARHTWQPLATNLRQLL